MANEKRLIDANAIEEKIEKNFRKLIANQSRPDLAAALSYVGDLIIEAPTVDAVEVVPGRWDTEKCDHVPWRIKNPEKWVIHKCSVCGYRNGRKHSNYCPNCGAKMDGDGNGNL